MVCRLLRSLQGGQLPDDGGALAVDGIVYLSDMREYHRVTVPDLYSGLTKLLSEETVKRLDAVYKNPQGSALPPIRSADDILGAIKVVSGAVGRGAITPGEGFTLSQMIETFLRAIDASD